MALCRMACWHVCPVRDEAAEDDEDMQVGSEEAETDDETDEKEDRPADIKSGFRIKVFLTLAFIRICPCVVPRAKPINTPHIQGTIDIKSSIEAVPIHLPV